VLKNFASLSLPNIAASYTKFILLFICDLSFFNSLGDVTYGLKKGIEIFTRYLWEKFAGNRILKIGKVMSNVQA
jgi:hypothetical protein